MRMGKKGFSDRYFLVLCVMGLFAILSSTMSKSPVLNPFATSLGTPSDLLGVVASVSTIPGILISLPAASLSDIVGRRKMLLFSAFVFASAPFLYLFVSTWWQLALVRFYHGFATAVFVPVTEATVAERFPTKRGERISIFNSVTGVGRTLAPALGGVILGLTSNGFHTLYFAVAVAGVTAFALAFLMLTESKKTETENVPAQKTAGKMFQGWGQIARNRSALIVSLVQASQYYVFGAVEFFIVGYTIDVAKLDAFYAGVFLSVEVAAIIITRPILGRISDKKGRRAPIIFGSIVSCLLLLAVPFTTQFPLLVLIAIGYGIGFAMVISSTSPLMSELAPLGLVGASMGFLCMMMDVGQTLGPFVSGVVLASFTKQYTVLFASLSFVLLASSIVFFFSKTAQKKTQI
jgi:MFS family permease